MNSFGDWIVYDSTNTIVGVYHGFIDDIAFAMASNSNGFPLSPVLPVFPSLYFRKAHFREVSEDSRNNGVESVCIRIYPDIIDSDKLNVSTESHEEFFDQLFKGRDITYDLLSNMGYDVIIHRQLTTEEIRQRALAKLTAEEKAALGL